MREGLLLCPGTVADLVDLERVRRGLKRKEDSNGGTEDFDEHQP